MPTEPSASRAAFKNVFLSRELRDSICSLRSPCPGFIKDPGGPMGPRRKGGGMILGMGYKFGRLVPPSLDGLACWAHYIG
jgi:hypothetical protein